MKVSQEEVGHQSVLLTVVIQGEQLITSTRSNCKQEKVNSNRGSSQRTFLRHRLGD